MLRQFISRVATAVLFILLPFVAASGWAQENHPRYRGTIIISTNGDMTRAAGYRALVKAYKEVQPEVTVKIELKGAAFGGSAGYPTWLNTQLASQNPRPDIVSGNYSPTYGSYVNFDYYRYCTNPYTGHRWDEDLNFDFCVERNNLGVRVMLPTQAVHIQWFYNKDLFERLGVDVPKTWPEFMALCEKVRAAGTIPTTLRFDFRYHQWLAEILWDQYSRPHFQYLRALPGDWCFNPDVDRAWHYDPSDPFNDVMPTTNRIRMFQAIRDGVIRYDTPAFVRFLENMKTIAQYTPSDFLVESVGTGGDPYSLFLRQEAAMHLDGTWLLPQIEKDMAELGQTDNGIERKLKPFRWGIFDTPPQVDPLVVGPVRSIESASGEYVSVIHKNQAQTDMVVDFVMFWLSAPGYQAHVDGQVAADEFIPTGKIMVRNVRIPERFEAMLADVTMIGNAENATNRLFLLPPAGSRLVLDARQILVEYIQNRIDAQEAARQFEAVAQASIAENMQRNNLPMALLDHPEADPNQYQ